jgi:hypothetical protein
LAETQIPRRFASRNDKKIDLYPIGTSSLH